jgi:amino acid transporter
MTSITTKVHKKLNELESTAICGNDITSSCLYVSALTIMYAGQYAWISLAIVALVLFLFRKIYGEVVGALPLNGGAYNALLNTTTKQMAALAACLTILSYMATAVISASEAMHYLQHLFEGLNLVWATIILLALFMILSIIGIGESAIVAVGIFIFHMLTLVLLVFTAIWFIANNGLDVFNANWHFPITAGSIKHALFFGFAAAMLGISGFESSANFVEEQMPGVFPKTLRNMWVAVSVFNPLIALLILAVLPIAQVGEHKESLLAFIGQTTGGYWLGTLISIDAVLVLSGAVLTSYVGVAGLTERITLDRIFPNFLLSKNRNGVNYRIIIAFFILCISVLFATAGDITALAGVYTFSFLAVMALFGIGNLLLKTKRNKLPRPEYAHPLSVIAAIIFVVIAFVGNMQLNPDSFIVFLQYLLPSVIFVMLMLNRVVVLKWTLILLEYIFEPIKKLLERSQGTLDRVISRINEQEFVFFTKGDDIAILNKVMLYVENNETTKKLKIVHVYKNTVDNELLKKDIDVLDRAYPDIDIEFLEIEGDFGPDLIEVLSQKWNIPKNFMFIGSPSNRFSYRVAELGGVRLIM